MLFFIYNQVLIENFALQANSGDPDQTPHSVWRLIWVCTVCLCPTKRTLGTYGLKMQLFCYLISVSAIGVEDCYNNLPSESALGTSDLSKFINMKILKIKLGKERQCHITNQSVHSFSVNNKISQPSKVMFTSASSR